MKVNTEIINLVKSSNRAKARLSYEFDVSPQTVSRWLDNEPDGELTKARAVKIIADELAIPEETVLTEQP
jgi:hypothetical protein